MLETLNLNELNGNRAVTLISHAGEGQEKHFSLDFFRTLGGFAYGAVMATEKTERETFIIDSALTGKIVRVPLEGVLEPGEVTVQVSTDNNVMVWPLERLEEIAPGLDWEDHSVTFDQMQLTDRAD